MKNATMQEYATIRYEGVEEKKLNDFAMIPSEVLVCTEKLAGNNFGVSSLPIYLTIYKKDIREDLTLIDLPGITRNPVGDQPKDIYTKVVSLIKKYIEKPTAIVLHVIPSSEDFTNSESMKISQEYDPNGDRQLIAVSKIDKYDKGIGNKLQGTGPGSMSLKLGCVAVLNRTQEQIEENVSFTEMRELEEKFFRTTQAFEHVPPQYLGCYQLIKRLASIQQTRIRSTLPGILDELKKQIKEKKLELKHMPPEVTSEMECWTLYTKLIKKYRDLIHARVYGVYDNDMEMKVDEPRATSAGSLAQSNPTGVKDDVLDGRIAFHLHKQQMACAKQISESFSQFFTEKYRKHVLKLLEENAGVALPNFPSFNIIESLYRYEHQRFREPCEKLIESCTAYLKQALIKLLDQVFDKEASYKDQMIHKLTDIIFRALDDSEEQCNNDVTKILEIEQRVFTLNHYYMDSVNKIKVEIQQFITSKSTPNQRQPNAAVNDFTINLGEVSNEHQAALDVQIAIKAYCRIVEKRIVDQVAQHCHYWLVTQGALTLDSKLSSAFTSAALFEWMREPFEQQQKRENLKRSIQSMERALSTGQHA